MAAQRPLLHLPIYGLACTGLYAGSLALMAMLQSQHNATVARDQTPLLDAMNTAQLERQGAEAALKAASGALDAATDSYASASTLSAQVDAAMAAFARQVSAITGSAARLPGTVKLPAAPGGVTHVAAPVTQATTGASGKP
jgi:hypothetical protein